VSAVTIKVTKDSKGNVSLVILIGLTAS
jgi:hypothetical protein